MPPNLFKARGSRCPVVVSVTLEPSGNMLVGSDISAITAALEPYDFIDVLSINCATGPSKWCGMWRTRRILAPRRRRRRMPVCPKMLMASHFTA
ncbi:hypothetical protein MASR1M12_34670 [Erysipelotrichia bacterium]